MKRSNMLMLAAGLIMVQPLAVAAQNTEAADMNMATARKIFNVKALGQPELACQDFDRFMNAQWVKDNPIPEDQKRWSAFDQLAEKSLDDQHDIVKKAADQADDAADDSIKAKIGHLYRSAMNTRAIDKAGFAPIKPKLDKIAELDDHQQLAQYLTRVFASGQGQVFDLYAGPDYKDAENIIAYAYQGGLGLPARKYYFDDDYASQRHAYVDYMTRLFKLVGDKDKQARRQARAAMKFETRLARHSLSEVEMRDPANQYHFVSLEEANELTPHFDWKRFFKTQHADIKKGFSLATPEFFQNFDRMLAKAPLSQWRAYLRFHAIDDAAPYLAEGFRDAAFDFYGHTLNGQPEQKARWKQALDAVNGAMGEALGQLYVKKYFPPEAKARAQEMVTNLQEALRDRIRHNDWMSEQTKKKALQKSDKFKAKIGYPSHWRAWDGLKIDAADFYGNIEAAARFNYKYMIDYLGQKRDRNRWSMSPQTVNAYYSPTDNTINFPAAILQPPFFYAHGDDAVNYGGIGAVIGHEMSHGYDDQGSQFDGDGNLKNWWTKADRKAFEERTQRLVTQFNQYQPLKDKPELHVDGKLTLGENIADLSGLTLSYYALQKALSEHDDEADARIDGFSQQQRFFMAWAQIWRGHSRAEALEVQLNSDPHAPMRYRAIGAPANMASFARAFSCSADDDMVRSEDKRVELW